MKLKWRELANSRAIPHIKVATVNSIDIQRCMFHDCKYKTIFRFAISFQKKIGPVIKSALLYYQI